jgi:hypothetical protein
LRRDTVAGLHEEWLIATTASRVTLGFMIQMAKELDYRVAYMGGLDWCDDAERTHAFQRTLRNGDGCTTSSPSLPSLAPHAGPPQPKTPRWPDTPPGGTMRYEQDELDPVEDDDSTDDDDYEPAWPSAA